MVVRQIRITGGEILMKKCKLMKAMNECTMELIEDMSKTVYQANGRDLTASQVEVLKQIVTISADDKNQYVLINPGITAADGSQTGYERRLSLPGKFGIVTRSNYVEVKALNENMEPYELEGEGLLVRATRHECAHLEGRMYVGLVEGELMNVAADEEEIIE